MFRSVTLSLCLVCSSALVVQAAAPSVSHAKKKKKKSKKAKKARKAKKATQKDAKKAQEEAEDRKSPARFDFVGRTDEDEGMDARADRKRDEAIAKLKKLLPTVREGPQKAELIFRLSEMFWAKAKFKNLKAMHLWDQALDEWDAKGSKGPQPKLEDMAELSESNLYKREALDLYARILDKYPNYPRKDEVLYNLGSSRYESGDKRAGVEMYWKLIKQYPRSDFAPDAWLQLGEHFFNANKLTQAVKAYSKAAETKKPRIYSFAIYKLAWCDYNLQEYENALEKFRSVISYAKKARAGTGAGDIKERDKIQLMDEALSDMVRTYSHLDAVDEAFDFYTEEVGKTKAYKYMKRLASMYDDEGKFAMEIRAYKMLNDRYPYRPEAPENQTAIMNAYAQANKKDMVRREVKRLIELYSPNGPWAQKNAGNDKVLESAFEIVEQELAGLVTEQHRAAQQTKLVGTYKLARDIYKDYLDKFESTINSYKFRFFYAEILYELKEFRKAAEEYDVVAQKKGEFKKPSAYTAILAWEKVAAGVQEGNLSDSQKIKEQDPKKVRRGEMKELEKIKKLQKGQKYAETPLTEPEQKLASACDHFVSIAGSDEEVVKVKFKSARLYYIHNQFEPAAERFGEIIDKWPKDSLARISAESIVESFNVREDWSNLNKWSRDFRSNKLLMGDKTFAKTIHEFVEGSTFNEILHVYEPKEGPKEIADRYLGFEKEFPKTKYSLVALYNAVVNYDKDNLLEKAIDQAERVLGEYKTFKISPADLEKSKRDGASLPDPKDLREKVMFLAASFYERLAQFERSADLYEQYAKEFEKGPKRADAFFNAGIFREGLGQFDKAIANFEAYTDKYPKKEDRLDITWRIGLIHEKKKDYKEAMKHFSGWARVAGRKDPARAMCAEYKVYQSLEKLGKDSEAKRAYAGLVRSWKKLEQKDAQEPCPLEAVGTASFWLLEPEFESYKAIPLKGVNDKQMQQNLLKKLELVGELEKKYTGVLKIGHGDYGIASLYRIGKVYQHLAQVILETECPKKLDMDQCEIYLAALQEKAFPLEEKAIEAFDKSLSKAYELGLYNEWLAKAQEAMKAYEPQRFPTLQKYDLIASEAVFEVPALQEVPQ